MLLFGRSSASLFREGMGWRVCDNVMKSCRCPPVFYTYVVWWACFLWFDVRTAVLAVCGRFRYRIEL